MDENEEINKLFSTSEKDFGDGYKDKLFEQYKLFLKMIDNLNERRSTANNFFLSVNTGLLTALGILSSLGIKVGILNTLWIIVGAAAGILFSYSWIRTVKSYGQLSSGKWQIIHAIERKLPLRLHETEWEVLKKGEDPTIYKPLTGVERTVPKIFQTIYVALIIVAVLIIVHVVPI